MAVEVKRKTIFMTGANGFIGTAVASALMSRGHFVAKEEIRLDNQSGLARGLSSQNFDTVIHLAAVSAFSVCEKAPDVAIATNVEGTRFLCEAVLQHAPNARLIFASSAQVYDASESALTEDSPVSPRTVYAKTKLAAERVIKTFSDRGLQSSILRIFNHTHYSQSSSFFLPGIFDQLIKAKEAGETSVRIKTGNLDIERDLGAIQDLCQAFIQIVETPDRVAFEILNISSGQARSLSRLVDLLAKKMNMNVEIMIEPSRFRADDPKHIVGDYSNFERRTGWRPQKTSDHDFIESFLADLGPRKDIATMIKIPVARPSLNGNEKRYVNDCLDSAWISSNGKYISQFEQQFSNIVGTPHALTCCNGTVALHLALLALGVGPGDEVIVPTFTYIATANAVSYVGAKLVLADVDPKTWCLSTETLKDKISARTKAIIVVHLYGHPVDMGNIMELARERNFKVIEDCAESLGATYNGKMTGTIGDIGTFSFFGNKTITTGEGGMVSTSSETLATRMRLLKGQGMDPDRRYWHPIVGYNYRMTNIEAAIGCAQLEKLDWHLTERRRVAARYDSHLKGIAGLSTQGEVSWGSQTYWMYSVLIDGATEQRRDRVLEELAKHGIETRPLFHCMHKMPPHFSTEVFPVSERISSSGLNLPTFASLTNEEIDYVCEKLQLVLRSV